MLLLDVLLFIFVSRVKLWNSLPVDVVLCSSIGSFKTKVRLLHTCKVVALLNLLLFSCILVLLYPLQPIFGQFYIKDKNKNLSLSVARRKGTATEVNKKSVMRIICHCSVVRG